jgi:transcriptional regulator with XRE-family HTH domain
MRGHSVHVARQVRELRGARGWSGAQLADAMAAEGFGWDRSTVTAIENGRRTALTIDEWLGLARVLSVAPLHLIVPVDAEMFTVTPDGPTVDADRARRWITGDDPSLSVDPGSSWWRRHAPPVKTGTAAARAVGGGRKTVETAEDRRRQGRE